MGHKQNLDSSIQLVQPHLKQTICVRVQSYLIFSRHLNNLPSNNDAEEILIHITN